MTLRHWLRNWGNPHNETRIFLADKARKYGFEIGFGTYGKPKVRFADSGAKLTIGSYGSIAEKVEIFLGGNHRTDFVTTYPFSLLKGLWPDAPDADVHASRGDVRIGSDVWIGSQAAILSGVTIGHGAVIGARAVVAKDIPPYAIAVGNPARVIRFRFDEATIQALLELEWWNLPVPEVKALIPLLQSADVAGAVEAIRARRRPVP